MITDYNLQILIEPLLHWFAGHARVLPWREEPTPYRVWVSEDYVAADASGSGKTLF